MASLWLHAALKAIFATLFLDNSVAVVAAALSHAERTIRALRKESGYNDPALMMMRVSRGRTI